MITKKEKLLQLVKGEDTQTFRLVANRINNRARLQAAQSIALQVLNKLNELQWPQSKLAKHMGVSPQQISKIVSGKENLTLDTIVRLQKILQIQLLVTYNGKPE